MQEALGLYPPAMISKECRAFAEECAAGRARECSMDMASPVLGMRVLMDRADANGHN